MKTVKLSSGYEMPIFGLGVFNLNDGDKEVVVRSVTEGGYRHIDTAKVYENEETIGQAIKEIGEAGIKREELFITTKLWRSDFADPVSACKESLKKLDLEYVDLYLIHWPTPPSTEDKKSFQKIPMHKIWEGMEKCVEEGLVRSIGISNFNTQIICDMLTYAKIQPAVNQIECHPYLQQTDFVEFCQRHNIHVTAYSPLSSPGRPVGGNELKNILVDPEINEIADKHGKTPAQIALAWNIQRNVIVIPKTTKLERAKENFEALEIDLTKEEIEKISKLDAGIRIFDPKNWEGFSKATVFE